MPKKPEQITPSAVRNALTLAVAQSVNGSLAAVAVSLGALAGAHLLPQSPELATLPVAGMNVGLALFAIPVALLCKRFGRRLGFIIGSIIGIVGALSAVLALTNSIFLLFCFGLLLIGGAGAFVQQYRFAATDQGSDKFKSQAISWVMTGGIFAAFIGPQTVIFTKDLLLPTPFAGAFLAGIGLLIIGIFILSFLKPEPIQTDKGIGEQKTGRPLSVIARQPKFIVALICAISSFALMTFVMTGAPLAMQHHHHSVDEAVLGIQWHILAMYGPSFFTGLLIVRFGKKRIIALGLALLLLCAAVALSGTSLWNFWTVLILLGLGWNFGFIGSTALLSETYSPDEKNTVQGAHDLILFSCVAAASLSSGYVLHLLGWQGLAGIIFPVAGLGLISLGWLWLREQRREKVSEGL